MKSTPDIVFSAVSTLSNRGVGALVNSLSAVIRKRHPAARISALCASPAEDRRLAPEGVELVQDCFATDSGRRITRAAAALGQRGLVLGAARRRAWEKVGGANLVLATGGDVFSSDYSGFSAALDVLRAARKKRVPYLFAAQSIGPFRTRAEADEWMEVAGDAAAVTLREDISYRYVTDELGLPAGRAVRTADPAFLLEPAAEADALSAYLGLKDGRPVIAAAPSTGISTFTGGASHDSHVEAWAGLIRTLLEKTDADVLLIPHVQDSNPRNDDRRIVSDILRRTGWPARVKTAGLDLSPNEFKAVIGRCEMVMAERMHAAIAGLSSGVATGVIGYSVKGRGILEDFDPAELPAGCSMLQPFDRFIAGTDRADVFLGLWEQRYAVADHIRKKLPDVQALAMKNFDVIDGLLPA